MKYPLAVEERRAEFYERYGCEPDAQTDEFLLLQTTLLNDAYMAGKRATFEELAVESEGDSVGIGVTFEDAANAFKSMGTDEMNGVLALYASFRKLCPEWGAVGALAAVFSAGRVDGVRRERARRRRKGGAAE